MRKFLAAALVTSALTAPALAAEATLKVVSIDVEGGGGTLFVTPEGKSLLIDSGWPGGYGLLPSPDGAQNSADRIVAAAKKLGLSEGNVTVHNTLLGGGFGRKSKCDYAIEAALLAKEAAGAPVKVIRWTDV